jgi:hypothetical protein
MIGKSAKGWKTEACHLVLYEVCEGELVVCFSFLLRDEEVEYFCYPRTGKEGVVMLLCIHSLVSRIVV